VNSQSLQFSTWLISGRVQGVVAVVVVVVVVVAATVDNMEEVVLMHALM
jgi:hypothetical protein